MRYAGRAEKFSQDRAGVIDTLTAEFATEAEARKWLRKVSVCEGLRFAQVRDTLTDTLVVGVVADFGELEA